MCTSAIIFHRNPASPAKEKLNVRKENQKIDLQTTLGTSLLRTPRDVTDALKPYPIEPLDVPGHIVGTSITWKGWCLSHPVTSPGVLKNNLQRVIRRQPSPNFLNTPRDDLQFIWMRNPRGIWNCSNCVTRLICCLQNIEISANGPVPHQNASLEAYCFGPTGHM